MNVPPEDSGPDDARRRPYDDVSVKVGEALRRAREDAGLSQTELGKRLRNRNGNPVSREKISTYERGQFVPEPRLRPQLAKALEVPEEELFRALAGTEPSIPFVGRVAKRLGRVERELDTLRERLNEHLAATEATLAAEEANRADRASRKAAKRSPGRRSSKGDQG
ncbi:MAG TPA: helix-turn-helix transcriptional regulator [Solirubrobacterales bacterium]|nr:helix-turn-helix transcriptional regulator [Solirubrobacterales bacterium]